MAIQRDKDGKFAGGGGMSMDQFVKMRNRNQLGSSDSTRNTGDSGRLVDTAKSEDKKKARADSKGTKLKESVGSQEVSRRSGLLGYKKVKK